MDDNLREQLLESFTRIKRIGMALPHSMNIHMGEFFTLKKISEHPQGNLTVSDIQTSMHITKPAISQMLGQLEKKGYLSREIDTNDRRRVIVKLTESGQQMMRETDKRFNTAFDAIITDFGEDNTRQLITLFDRFVEATIRYKAKLQAEIEGEIECE